MDALCCMFSHALDVIEEEQLGVSERHAVRVAALCAAMGKKAGYDDDTLSALAICAMFHDNALTEYHLSGGVGEHYAKNMILHCEKGQSNVSWLPFKQNIDGFILYHHERGNGKGPFHKHEGEYPQEAAFIAAADLVDATHHLQHLPIEELPALRNKIESRAETYSTHTAVEALLEILDEDMLESLRNENISQTIERSLPRWEVDVSDPSVVLVAGFAAHIIDWKSAFTHMHTSQIASRSWLMAEHYGYSHEERSALFLAASLHDIGKIATPTDILEKPGALSAEEFKIIQQHVQNTYDWLNKVPGFDTVTYWASSHHEKLDGTGYPFRKHGDALDFNARLLACLDIYQAVIEPRPYHASRSHTETMQILHSMANKGQIDDQIVKDIDEVMEPYSSRSIPPLF